MSDQCSTVFAAEETPTAPSFADEAAPTVVAPSGAGCAATGPGATGFVDTGPKEFLADFNTSTHFVVGGSVFRRPDAVSFDYLISYSFGPRNIGDASFGAVDRLWRARVVNDASAGIGAIYLSRANDTNTAWEAEQFLFSFSGVAREVDLAFEQNARAVVCLELADDHVWLYWFDTVPSTFVLTDFGTGRTPRVLLDNPQDTTDSDVLFFYIRDATDEVVYRQQRDRYATIYSVPISPVGDRFLEDVFRATDSRLVVIYSQRNTTTGRYSLGRLESTLYPVYVSGDGVTAAMDVIAGSSSLVTIFIDVILFDIDQVTAALDILATSTLAPAVIDHTLFDIDQFTAALDILTSSALDVVVIEHTLFDVDQATAALDILTTSTLLVVVIEYNTFPGDDQFTAALDILASSTLA